MSQYDIELDDGIDNTSHALILDLVGHNKHVLDIGCSTGYLAKVLLERGCSVDGVEIDTAAAARAEEFCGRVVVGSLDELDLLAELGAGSYDVLVLGDVLEHLVDPGAVLRRVTPLLRPQGSVVISVPNITHGSVRLSLLEGRFEYTEVGLLDRTHVHFFTRASLQRLLRECGLVQVDMRRTTADVEATEIPVDLSRVPRETLDRLAEDRDATSYQFVCRAVVDDADSAVADLAERMEASQLRVHDLEVALASVASGLSQSAAQLLVCRAETEQAREELVELRAAAAHLDRLTREWDAKLRAPRFLTRRLVGAVRDRLGGRSDGG